MEKIVNLIPWFKNREKHTRCRCKLKTWSVVATGRSLEVYANPDTIYSQIVSADVQYQTFSP